MIAQVDRDGNGKISIEGIIVIHCIFNESYSVFLFTEFAALVERDS